MVEEERKFQVATPLDMRRITKSLPSAYRLVSRGSVEMRATYFDTADLRLARAGVSLRYRTGDPDAPWTVKLPTEQTGVRHEIGRPAALRRPAATIPADLVALVTVFSRGAPLAPVVTIRTSRTRWDVCRRDDDVLAEIADDAVAVYEDRRVVGRFHEVEVERKNGKRKQVARIGKALADAGAVEGVFTAKHVRALQFLPTFAARATAPADLARAPAATRPSGGRTDGMAGVSMAEAVTWALRTDIARILDHDPLIRLRAPVGRDDTAVHRMRVGVRRLRSTMRLFGTIFATPDTDDPDGTDATDATGNYAAPTWRERLDGELRWLGDLLGAARDAEVTRVRLRNTASLDPVHQLDAAAVARIEAELAAQYEEAYANLGEALASERYLALVEMLHTVAAHVDFAAVARRPASVLMPRAVGRAWRRLAEGRHGIDGADSLDLAAADPQWHAVRIHAKRARYAAESAVGICGVSAQHLADALAAVTDVLGSHQDAVTAAEHWLAIAAADPDDHALAITAGRLIERENEAAMRARLAYPDAWRAASADRLRSWLR